MKINIDFIYPVGSIYFSVNNVNPSTYFGGTWVSWGSGRVPVGVDINQTEFNSVEKNGGEKEHKLTIGEMPYHKHKYNRPQMFSWDYLASGTSYSWNNNLASNGGVDNAYTDYEGNSLAHNNLQPYITCYMWKRTA